MRVYHGGTPNKTVTTDDDYLWYYVIYINSSNYYYATSVNQLSSYDNIQWKQSTRNPLDDLLDVIQNTLVDVDLSSIPSDIQTSIPDDQITVVDVADNSSDSQGDSEGDSEGDSSGDSGGDSDGGGDSGGDGGGGDGGGGDGGGSD